jgi:hypothetical protein
LDDTLWGSAKKGFIITDANFYYATEEIKGNIPLEDIKSLKIVLPPPAIFLTWSRLYWVIILNDKELQFTLPEDLSGSVNSFL